MLAPGRAGSTDTCTLPDGPLVPCSGSVASTGWATAARAGRAARPGRRTAPGRRRRRRTRQHRAAQHRHVLGRALGLGRPRAAAAASTDGVHVVPPGPPANACAVTPGAPPGRAPGTPRRCCTHTRETPAAPSMTATSTSLASEHPAVARWRTAPSATRPRAPPAGAGDDQRDHRAEREPGEARAATAATSVGGRRRPQQDGEQAGEAAQPDRHGRDVHDGDDDRQPRPRPGDGVPDRGGGHAQHDRDEAAADGDRRRRAPARRQRRPQHRDEHERRARRGPASPRRPRESSVAPAAATGSSSEPSPRPAAYGPLQQEARQGAERATAPAPQIAIRRSRADAQPAGQQASASSGTPTARASAGEPDPAASRGIAARDHRVGAARAAAAPVGTKAPLPTTKE